MNSLQVDPRELLHSPDFFLHTIDVERDAAWFARMNGASYRTSSFLDERIVRAAPEPLRLPLSGLLQLFRETGPALPRGRYIFHVGHCGSTLLARVLDDVPDLFVLREPLLLRILTEMLDETAQPDGRLEREQWDELLMLGCYMLSRCYASTDTAVIKATSICGNLLQPCLETSPDSRAVLMALRLDTYLATMLRPQRRPELGANARLRMRQMQAFTGRDDLRFYRMSDSQKAVMNWLTTMGFFAEALSGSKLEEQVMLVDFDELLGARAEHLERIAAFLGRELDAAAAESLAASAHFERYAKNPERAFSSIMRQQQLDESRRLVAPEIADGLAWARELCDNSKNLSPLADWLETH